jgi:hypothetical protein
MREYVWEIRGFYASLRPVGKFVKEFVEYIEKSENKKLIES